MVSRSRSCWSTPAGNSRRAFVQQPQRAGGVPGAQRLAGSPDQRRLLAEPRAERRRRKARCAPAFVGAATRTGGGTSPAASASAGVGVCAGDCGGVAGAAAPRPLARRAATAGGRACRIVDEDGDAQHAQRRQRGGERDDLQGRRPTFDFVAVVIVLADASAAAPAPAATAARRGAPASAVQTRASASRGGAMSAPRRSNARWLSRAARIREEANRIVSGAHARLPRLSACGAGSPASSPTAAPNAARARRSRE